MEFSNCGDFYFDNFPLVMHKCRGMTFSHGFSTRLGGITDDEDRGSLDLGAGDGEDVSENRKRFANALLSDTDVMFSAKQIHSDKILCVTKDDIGQYFECDGFVTSEKGILLTVKIADCVPILFEDVENGVIGASHAGWRGTVAGIAQKTIESMEKLGAKRENIIAVIGPSIHSCCYEVDDPFVCAVKGSPCAEIVLPFISPKNKLGKYFADLQGMNYALLSACGIQKIYVSPLCTCCNKDVLFSHRGSNGKRGLMMAWIIMN